MSAKHTIFIVIKPGGIFFLATVPAAVCMLNRVVNSVLSVNNSAGMKKKLLHNNKEVPRALYQQAALFTYSDGALSKNRGGNKETSESPSSVGADLSFSFRKWSAICLDVK